VGVGGGSLEALRRKVVLERKALTRLGIKLIGMVFVFGSWFGDKSSVVSRLVAPRVLTWKGTSTLLMLSFRWGLGSWARA
jgi:predicted cation transporter